MEKFIEVKVRVLGPQSKEGQLKLVSLEIAPVNKLPEITDENINEKKSDDPSEGKIFINMEDEYLTIPGDEYILTCGFKLI